MPPRCVAARGARRAGEDLCRRDAGALDQADDQRLAHRAGADHAHCR